MHCITITIDGLVVVCDRQHNRMQFFRKDGTFVRETFVLKDSYPGTIGSIVKWPDAAQTYLLVVDDPNGQFHVVNRVSSGGELVSAGRPPARQFYNLHFIGIDSKEATSTAPRCRAARAEVSGIGQALMVARGLSLVCHARTLVARHPIFCCFAS